MLKRILIYCIGFYVIINVYAYLFSDYVAFPKPEASYQNTKDIIKLTTKDGETISAVYLPNSKATYTILVNHGNAEDLGDILPFLQKFHAEGFAVFAYDYQGYGTSTGKPTEKNAYADSEAAYDYLTKQLHIPENHIILYGRSLGAAFAIDLATQKPVAGLIIESPFITGFRSVTQIPLLFFDRFNNLAKIKKVKCPLLVIHGKKDKIILFWQGKKLYQVANAPKSYLWVANAGHNDVEYLAGDAYWKAVDIFTSQLNARKNNGM